MKHACNGVTMGITERNDDSNSSTVIITGGKRDCTSSVAASIAERTENHVTTVAITEDTAGKNRD